MTRVPLSDVVTSEGDKAGMWNQLELHVSVSAGSIDGHFLIDVTLIGVFPKTRP